jgi:hypothetical protein
MDTITNLLSLQNRAPLFDLAYADEVRIGFAAAVELADRRARSENRRYLVRQAFADDGSLQRFYAVQAWR